MKETKRVYKIYINGEVEFITDNFSDLLELEIYPNTTDYTTNNLYDLLDYYCDLYDAEIYTFITLKEDK